MNTTTFNVYPNLKKTITMVKARIDVYEYRLFEYAMISCVLLDANDLAIETRIFKLDNTNGFEMWNNDDQVLVNWVKAELQKDTIY